MESHEAWRWLDAHVNLESVGVPPGVSRRAVQPTLDRMEALVALLGSPQLEYPVLHVTGTNGKTSVARMAAALLIAHGLSTGLSTSPHLERVNERIVWNGHPIEDETLAELLVLIAEIEPHLAAQPSFFEILTGAAFRWFADVAVEAAVIEVGLGGRWDATNVADGQVAVVTNISVDHVEYLGPTRDDIAAEKAGIVKPGSTLVLGETDSDLEPLFRARDAQHVVTRDRDFGITANAIVPGGRILSIYTPTTQYSDVFLSVHGAHQADNAAIALTAVECLFERPVDENVVAQAFGSMTSPGRLEVIGRHPLVILDGAHNVAGARALRAALAEEFPAALRTGIPRIMVVGLLREKDPAEMLEALGVAEIERLVCCRPPSLRGLPPEEVAAAAEGLGLRTEQVLVEDRVDDAVERAVQLAGADGQVVVAGSLYVVGAARSALSTRS